MRIINRDNFIYTELKELQENDDDNDDKKTNEIIIMLKDKEILISAMIGMILSIILTFILVHKFKEIGEAITILLTELVVCGSFIYFSKRYYDFKQFLPLIMEQILGGVPYILIIICVKLLILNSYLQLGVISLLSFGWFILFHFNFLKNSLIKEQVLLFLKKTAKQTHT